MYCQCVSPYRSKGACSEIWGMCDAGSRRVFHLTAEWPRQFPCLPRLRPSQHKLDAPQTVSLPVCSLRPTIQMLPWIWVGYSITIARDTSKISNSSIMRVTGKWPVSVWYSQPLRMITAQAVVVGGMYPCGAPDRTWQVCAFQPRTASLWEIQLCEYRDIDRSDIGIKMCYRCRYWCKKKSNDMHHYSCPAGLSALRVTVWHRMNDRARFSIFYISSSARRQSGSARL